MADMPRPLVAQAAEAAELRELLAAVLEAVDVPYAATTGGEEVRHEVLAKRAMRVAVAVREVVQGLPSYLTSRDQTRYLRESMEECPARGYVTVDTARARREAGQTYMASVTPQTDEEKTR